MSHVPLVGTSRYAQLGLSAQMGASNPVGLLNALIEAIAEYPGGAWDATRDPGLRAIAHQTVSLYGIEFPRRSAADSVCRELIAATKEFGRDSHQAIGIAHHLARIFAVDDFSEHYAENMTELDRRAAE